VHGDSLRYGQPTSRGDGINIIRAAVDARPTHVGKAELYGSFVNEELVGEALGPVRDRVVLGFRIENGKRRVSITGRRTSRRGRGLVERVKTDGSTRSINRVDPDVRPKTREWSRS
jgi:aryl-alcohol dehydrogenase-like predicted oxidoreductase